MVLRSWVGPPLHNRSDWFMSLAGQQIKIPYRSSYESDPDKTHPIDKHIMSKFKCKIKYFIKHQFLTNTKSTYRFGSFSFFLSSSSFFFFLFFLIVYCRVKTLKDGRLLTLVYIDNLISLL